MNFKNFTVNYLLKLARFRLVWAIIALNYNFPIFQNLKTGFNVGFFYLAFVVWRLRQHGEFFLGVPMPTQTTALKLQLRAMQYHTHNTIYNTPIKNLLNCNTASCYTLSHEIHIHILNRLCTGNVLLPTGLHAL